MIASSGYRGSGAAYGQKGSQTVDIFGGISRKKAAVVNQFINDINMSADEYPALATRRKRGYALIEGDDGELMQVITPGKLADVVSVDDEIIYGTENGVIVRHGEYISSSDRSGNGGLTQLILTGRRIYTLPSGLLIDGKDKRQTELNISGGLTVASDLPGEFTVTDSSVPGRLDAFLPNQAAVISSDIPELNGVFTVLEVSAGSILFAGNVDTSALPDDYNITLARRMPRLDFGIEHNNRIFACRYGTNDEGNFVNEIYASRLGDPLSWLSFSGMADDPFVASVGTPGEWTGCGVCGDNVIFFKENCFFTVYGDTAADFRIIKTEAPGVQRGCRRSVVSINGRLYYKSAHGVMCLSPGGLPYCVSDELGPDMWENARAGTDGLKYYILMERDGRAEQYVYDTGRGIWHAEDAERDAVFFFNHRNNLICASSTQKETEYGTVLRPAYLTEKMRTWTDAAKVARLYALYLLITVNDGGVRRFRPDSDIQALIDAHTIPYETVEEAKTAAAEEVTVYYHEFQLSFTDGEAVRTAEIPQSGLTEDSANGTAETKTVFISPELRQYYYAESCLYGLSDSDEKQVNMIDVRAGLAGGASLNIQVQYDDDGEWRDLKKTVRERSELCSVRIKERLKNCETFRLRFSGFGEVTVYSVKVNMIGGGDRNV